MIFELICDVQVLFCLNEIQATAPMATIDDSVWTTGSTVTPFFEEVGSVNDFIVYAFDC
jgi:hypothetical protein